MILLTSFKESRNLLSRDGIKRNNLSLYSVARNQPSGFTYKSLPFLAALDVHGQKLKLRGVEDPINTYRNKLFEYYNSVCEELISWAMSLNNQDMDILCCWCPYSEATRNQVRIYNTFVCHTGLIGGIINDLRPDIDVYLDIDRHHKLILEYKPKNYKPMVW